MTMQKNKFTCFIILLVNTFLNIMFHNQIYCMQNCLQNVNDTILLIKMTYGFPPGMAPSPGPRGARI